MLVDYHIHGLAHGTASHSPALLNDFVLNAEKRGVVEMGFAEHDDYLHEINWANLKELSLRVNGLKIRVGLEVEYLPGQERGTAARLAAFPFDYLIGSVHQIDGWMFDHPDYQEGYSRWDIDVLYHTYFDLLIKAVQSGLFDIIGHLDLIKVFGYRASFPVEKAITPLLTAIKQKGMVVEINTNGLNKPVGEIYPHPSILERCYQFNIPITLGSDAHQPDAVGRQLDLARELAIKTGYRRLVCFSRRKKYFRPL
ncbi:MAG: histidinol-phosphatase [Bacillota bacterium]|jgi:histidinol-phosphatase (PHP family)